jgi:hypothetical protein
MRPSVRIRKYGVWSVIKDSEKAGMKGPVRAVSNSLPLKNLGLKWNHLACRKIFRHAHSIAIGNCPSFLTAGLDLHPPTLSTEVSRSSKRLLSKILWKRLEGLHQMQFVSFFELTNCLNGRSTAHLSSIPNLLIQLERVSDIWIFSMWICSDGARICKYQVGVSSHRAF